MGVSGPGYVQYASLWVYTVDSNNTSIHKPSGLRYSQGFHAEGCLFISGEWEFLLLFIIFIIYLSRESVSFEMIWERSVFVTEIKHTEMYCNNNVKPASHSQRTLLTRVHRYTQRVRSCTVVVVTSIDTFEREGRAGVGSKAVLLDWRSALDTSIF